MTDCQPSPTPDLRFPRGSRAGGAVGLDLAAAPARDVVACSIDTRPSGRVPRRGTRRDQDPRRCRRSDRGGEDDVRTRDCRGPGAAGTDRPAGEPGRHSSTRGVTGTSTTESPARATTATPSTTRASSACCWNRSARVRRAAWLSAPSIPSPRSTTRRPACRLLKGRCSSSTESSPNDPRSTAGGTCGIGLTSMPTTRWPAGPRRSRPGRRGSRLAAQRPLRSRRGHLCTRDGTASRADVVVDNRDFDAPHLIRS